MSSPLSLLKKTRRSLLQDPFNEQWNKQKVPSRKDLLQECQAVQVADYSSDSHPLLSSHNLSNDAPTSKSKASLKQDAPPNDVGLMSAMMQRVTLLEKTVKSLSQKIEHKEKKLAVLGERLKAYEESVNAHCQSDIDELDRRCRKLQKQVDEMGDFLSDYDLIWRDGVNSHSDRSEQTETSHFGPSGTSAVRNFHMNFDLALQRIKELNVLAGDGESFVQTTATGAKLSTKDPIQLRLYSNGIVMFDGPFRSYQEESTQMCIQDVMDGYFPSELRQRFPDGIPFEVHDMRHEEYPAKLPWDTFPGEGQSVCGKKVKSTNAVRSQLSGKKLSTDLFLSKFPKFVVKAGQVIDIRDSLRTRLQGSSAHQSSGSVITIDTPVPQAAMYRSPASSSNSPQSAKAVITLKVKSEDGSHTYVVKMCLSETVGHLRSYLDKHRGAAVPDYDIISAYPQCCFNDDGLTLQSYGLSTNATLLLRKKQK